MGTVVGSGIFVAPAAVAAAAPGPLAGAALWIAAALPALCGALVYAECATRVPLSGGFFAFQREALGEGIAFVGGWAAVLVTYPASAAAIALVGASYLGEIVPGAGGRWTALLALAGAAALNVLGLRTGPRTQRALTFLKVAAVAALLAAALSGARGAPEAAPPLAAAPDAGVLGAFLYLLWAYEGWSNVSLVAGEIREPDRSTGRAVYAGFAVLVALYAAVQAAVSRLLPASTAAASGRVFADAVEVGLGSGAGRFVAALVALSAFGALHGVVLAVSRLALAMGRDGALPGWTGRWSPRFGTPAPSVAGVAALSGAYVFLGSFGDLLAYFTFSVWIFYGISAVALIRLRRRGVGDPEGWRAPGGAAVPWVVLGTAAVITAGVAARDPWRSAAGLGLILLGVPAYAARRLRRRPSGSGARPR